MSELEEQLKDLKRAWDAFKETAASANEQQRKAFADAIKDMDDAEIPLKREEILKCYG